MAQVATFTNSNEIALPNIISQMIVLVRERFQAQKARAALRAELNQYSDRELSDIGLSRSDIEDIVHNRYAAACQPGLAASRLSTTVSQTTQQAPSRSPV